MSNSPTRYAATLVRETVEYSPDGVSVKLLDTATVIILADDSVVLAKSKSEWITNGVWQIATLKKVVAPDAVDTEKENP